MVLLGSIIVYYGKAESLGVSIVGGVPEGLPIFQIPEFSLEKIKLLLPTILTVTLIGIVESIGIAKVLQAKHQNYQIRANQELVALGFSKLVGSFFQAEDGIRDSVASRGLGDVYKRQQELHILFQLLRSQQK